MAFIDRTRSAPEIVLLDDDLALLKTGSILKVEDVRIVLNSANHTRKATLLEWLEPLPEEERLQILTKLQKIQVADFEAKTK